MEKTKRIDLSLLTYGKVPPHSKDLEEKILGALLLEPTIFTSVKEILSPNDFYLDNNRTICEAIYKISESTPCDLTLLFERLYVDGKIEEVGGAYTLTKLTNDVTSTANIIQYCTLVKQKSIQRRLINFSSVILNGSYENEDVFDLLSNAENTLKGINFELNELKVSPISDIAAKVVEKFESRVYKARNDIKDESLIYTGIKEWDDFNGSLFSGLYVVAGRPGMGKGVHMTELICRMGKDKHIGVVNGEMTDEQLMKRVGCNLLGFDNFLYKKNPKWVTDEEQQMVRDAMEAALQLNIHIEKNRNIHKIANKIRLWVEKYKVKVVLADFLTLFKVPPELDKYYSDVQKINYVLDVFVTLCGELDIPIIIYAQMNRQIMGRHGNKEPNLSDLKGAGSIEELAVQVSFLHRPEYYDEKAVTDEFGEDIKGLMYQIIAKHREGEMGRFKMKAELSKSKLRSWGDLEIPTYKASTITDMPF